MPCALIVHSLCFEKTTLIEFAVYDVGTSIVLCLLPRHRTWTTGANSSAKRLRHLAGILSAPEAFLGFRCFKTDLAWSIDRGRGRGGGY